MKICFFASSSTKVGADGALLELIDAFKKLEVESFVIMPSKGALMDALNERNISAVVVPYKGWMSHKDSLASIWKRCLRILWNLSNLFLIVILVAWERCDIIYTNSIGVCVGALVAKTLRKPHIWHIHEFGYEDNGYIFDFGEKFSMRMIDKLSSACIVVSQAVKEKYQRYVKPEKLNVIYQSVTIPDNFSQADIRLKDLKGLKCVIVGRVVEGKAQEDAIKAVAELVRAGEQVFLWIVGEGTPEYRNQLFRLIEKERIDKYIKFFGFLENPFPVIEKSDLALMCSKSEAFGRTTIEAMLMGKPVIASRSGANPELIQEGVSGFLYEPGNYIDLAKKIRIFVENPILAQKMGGRAKSLVKNKFTQEHYGKKVLSLLQIVTGKF